MTPSDSFRRATEADYPVFARLFPGLATGDPTPTPDVWRSVFLSDTFVLEREGRPLGYVYMQVFDGLAYIRQIVVDPGFRGRGLGRSLMQGAAGRAREAGVERWCLNVKPDNEPAVRLYRQMGLSPSHAAVAMRMGWDIVSRLPEPPPDVTTTELLPADDPLVEQALDLPTGVLARQRSRPEVRLWVSHRAGAIAGVAVFSPSFPGAHPFVADAAETIAALLTAMRSDADPRFDYVQLVLERVPPLATALEGAGAVRHLEYVCFVGAIPPVSGESGAHDARGARPLVPG